MTEAWLRALKAQDRMIHGKEKKSSSPSTGEYTPWCMADYLSLLLRIAFIVITIICLCSCSEGARVQHWKKIHPYGGYAGANYIHITHHDSLAFKN